MNLAAAIRRPSAFVPLLMSGAAMADVLCNVAIAGTGIQTGPAADENGAAHIFQMLMTAQAPFIVYGAVRWLPQDWRTGLLVMALQAGAIALALTPVFVLKL